MSNFSFSTVPNVRYRRSRFDLSHGVKTTMNVGTLYPVDVQEIYAGDTFKERRNFVTRLNSQFLKPVMDNLFMDVYYFFVPSRLLYDHYPNIFGENTSSSWANTTDYSAPVLPRGTIIGEKSVGDYLGLPTKVELAKPVSILPFRGFAKVYDDWFRDQNNVSPMHVQTGEIVTSELNTNSGTPWGPNSYVGRLPKVAKFHDYFTSCLPSPQKGQAVDINVQSGFLPVFTGNTDHPDLNVAPLRYNAIAGSTLTTSSGNFNILGTKTSGVSRPLSAQADGTAVTGTNLVPVAPVNLYADASSISPVSVNDLRFAFQFQKLLERDARSGTRYVEYLASHFGVSNPDSRLQRSEFLGGKRMPISIQQVVQSTGANSDASPLGEVGAYSLSNGRNGYTKSFTEHGYVFTVACIRQHHTYQQGIEKFWTRSKRTDFYDHVFANIGEQPVYRSEIFTNSSVSADTVFGYNEAWADLRQRQNRVSGEMRSNSTNTLDFWHFADQYVSAPVLGAEFIAETPSFVDRTITVPSAQQDQFIVDMWADVRAYRVMPTYSVPSLIDHN